MRAIAAMIALCGGLVLTSCTTMQATPYVNSSAHYGPSDASRVDVLYSPPQRPYTSIGIVSAKKYKPGFSDPSISDAIPYLRGAAAQIGADAVIVRGTHAPNDRRIITVEGEAIRYNDVARSTASTFSGSVEPAARSFAAGAQCSEGFEKVSEIDGRAIFEARCPATNSKLLIECWQGICRKLN